MSSLRDLILGADDLKTKAVPVPEWMDTEGKPVTVYIKQMNGIDRLKWASGSFVDGKTIDAYRERLLAYCLVDEKGEKIFSDADIAALGEKNGAVTLRLFLACDELNALSIEQVEEAVKNS
jgi:hypothetical protein